MTVSVLFSAIFVSFVITECELLYDQSITERKSGLTVATGTISLPQTLPAIREGDPRWGDNPLPQSTFRTMKDKTGPISRAGFCRLHLTFAPHTLALMQRLPQLQQKFLRSPKALRRSEDTGRSCTQHFQIGTPAIGQNHIGQEATVTINNFSIILQGYPFVENQIAVQFLGRLPEAIGLDILVGHLGCINAQIADPLTTLQDYGVAVTDENHFAGMRRRQSPT